MNQIGRELGVGYLGRLGAQGQRTDKASGSSASESSACEIEIVPRAAYERDGRLPPRSGRDRLQIARIPEPIEIKPNEISRSFRLCVDGVGAMQIKAVPATPVLSKYARESAGARSQMTLSKTRVTLSKTRDKMLVRTLDDL